MARGSNRFGAFVRREIVENDDIALGQELGELCFDIGLERSPVYWPVEDRIAARKRTSPEVRVVPCVDGTFGNLITGRILQMQKSISGNRFL